VAKVTAFFAHLHSRCSPKQFFIEGTKVLLSRQPLQLSNLKRSFVPQCPKVFVKSAELPSNSIQQVDHLVTRKLQ